MKPLHSAEADAEPLQLSSKISLNLDDQTSEKTSCWQQFRSLKRKYYWILITILLAVIASIVIGTTIGFSPQSGDESQIRLQNEETFRPNPGNIGSYLFAAMFQIASGILAEFCSHWTTLIIDIL